MSAHVDRLPPRRTGARLWSLRIFGAIATAALLAVGATIVMTFVPDQEASITPTAPAATAEPAPAAKKKAKAKPAEPKLTKAQRAARAAAVDVLSQNGYRPVTVKDYRPGATLRVLIGRGDGGQRAFFFAGGTYLGNDAADDSDAISVARAGNKSVALRYRTFEGGKKGSTRVLFRWDGEALAPQTPIPPSSLRHAR